MKLLEREEIVAPVQAREADAPRYVERPNIAVRGRFVAKPATKRRKGSALGDFCSRVVFLSAIVGTTYVASTLGGYVVLERARQSARHGAERAVYARGQAKEARESIEALTNPTALRAWAEERGFTAGEKREETLVARR